jgi:hypothetical protein
VTAASVPLVVSRIQERERRHRERDRRLIGHFRFWTAAGGRLVEDISDSETLGVTPAAEFGSSTANQTLGPPPYVRRAADDELDTALKSNPFALLVGDSSIR